MDSEVSRLFKQQDKDLDSKPELGRIVWLRTTANVSLGGTIEDVTDLVHPDNRAAAVTAAEACLLDVAGVGFISTDISRPWKDGYGKIIEINAGPGTDLHMQPTSGSQQDVSYHMIRSHIPAHRPQLFPTIVISGYYGKESVAQLCAHLSTRTGLSPGLLVRNTMQTSFCKNSVTSSFFEQMSTLNRHKEIDISIVAQSIKVLATEGLCIEKINCAVLTDDKIPDTFDNTMHDPSIAIRTYRFLADMSTHGVVIDGNSEVLSEAVSHLPPERVIKVWATPFSLEPDPLRKHLEKGGRRLGVRLTSRENEYLIFWYQKNSSSHLFSVPLKTTCKIKPLMMALGALLVSTTSLDRLQLILREDDNLYQKTPATLNSLITDICPIKSIRVACDTR